MKIVDASKINSFASAEQSDVPPVEESIFVLTASQLQGIISRAVQESTEPLYREIAYDRQRIAKLEQKEPQPLQRDRGDILQALIAVNGGKMLAKEARQKMHLSKPLFSMLIASMSDHIETKPLHSDKRNLVIYIKR
jgi:hypothetical protein